MTCVYCRPLLKLEQLHPALLSDDTKVPIKPGFFKGMYGGHGTEIVLLSYDLEKNIAEARKITVSIRVLLS